MKTRSRPLTHAEKAVMKLPGALCRIADALEKLVKPERTPMQVECDCGCSENERPGYQCPNCGHSELGTLE